MSSSYSSEFKQNAVKLAVESDQSIAQTAKDLGVNPNTLYTWVTKYHQPEVPANKGVGEKHPYEELKRLRRENAQLKEERDILKKAAAYFAKNSR
ncbi:MAG TPA: transposase [Desulfuromonadales bacterium]|jgi:transposase|nr:transposase [Desulfuromonadales bacterium]